MIIKNKRVAGIVLTVTMLLLIPLIAMQFTNAVNWSVVDFAVAGVLLLGSGLLGDLVLRNVKKPRYQIFLYGVILAALLLIWLELAVGIFGTPFAGS